MKIERKKHEYTCRDGIKRKFNAFGFKTYMDLLPVLNKIINSMFLRINPTSEEVSDEKHAKTLLIVFEAMFNEKHCDSPLPPEQIPEAIDTADIPELIRIALLMAAIDIDLILNALVGGQAENNKIQEHKYTNNL